jgi:hypothetical protein
MNSYVSLKYAGKLYTIKKAPYETEEKAYDRAWYICQNLMDESHITMSWETKDCLSHIWANEKYLSMKYK